MNWLRLSDGTIINLDLVEVIQPCSSLDYCNVRIGGSLMKLGDGDKGSAKLHKELVDAVMGKAQTLAELTKVVEFNHDLLGQVRLEEVQEPTVNGTTVCKLIGYGEGAHKDMLPGNHIQVYNEFLSAILIVKGKTKGYVGPDIELMSNGPYTIKEQV